MWWKFWLDGFFVSRSWGASFGYNVNELEPFFGLAAATSPDRSPESYVAQ